MLYGSTEANSTNIELIRSLYTCPLEERLDVLLSAMSPDIIIYQPEVVSFVGGTYRGIAGVGHVYVKWNKVISPESKLITVCTDGEYVVAIRKIYTADEVPYETEVAECWRFNNEKIIELRSYYYNSEELGAEIRKRFFHGRLPFQPFLC